MQPDEFDDCDDPDTEDTPVERPHGVRFGEGQRANGHGRPKGSHNRTTVIKRVAKKRHRVKIGGTVRTRSGLELVLTMVRARAARGEISAFELQERLKRRFATFEPAVLPGLFITGEKLTVEEWEYVYNPDQGDLQTETSLGKKFPYLVHMREKNINYNLERDAQIRASQELYNKSRINNSRDCL